LNFLFGARQFVLFFGSGFNEQVVVGWVLMRQLIKTA